MNNPNYIFASNLRRHRKERNLTQVDLSSQLKVNRRRYATWEEGTAFPPLEFLIKICDILKVDDLYLFLSKETINSEW